MTGTDPFSEQHPPAMILDEKRQDIRRSLGTGFLTQEILVSALQNLPPRSQFPRRH